MVDASGSAREERLHPRRCGQRSGGRNAGRARHHDRCQRLLLHARTQARPGVQPHRRGDAGGQATRWARCRPRCRTRSSRSCSARTTACRPWVEPSRRAATATTSRRRPRNPRTSRRRASARHTPHAATDAQRLVLRSRQRRDPARPRDARHSAHRGAAGGADRSAGRPVEPGAVAAGERRGRRALAVQPAGGEHPRPAGLAAVVAQPGPAEGARSQAGRPARRELPPRSTRWSGTGSSPADKLRLGRAAGVRLDELPELQAGGGGAARSPVALRRGWVAGDRGDVR